MNHSLERFEPMQMADQHKSFTPEHPVVLIVEDDDLLRALLAEFVTDLGAVVHTEPTADAGLQAVFAHPELDLLITDVVTPGTLSGWDLAVQVHDQRPQLPVIVTSGYSPKWSGTLPPGTSFLRKPWSLDDICKMMAARLHGD